MCIPWLLDYLLLRLLWIYVIGYLSFRLSWSIAYVIHPWLFNWLVCEVQFAIYFWFVWFDTIFLDSIASLLDRSPLALEAWLGFEFDYYLCQPLRMLWYDAFVIFWFSLLIPCFWSHSSTISLDMSKLSTLVFISLYKFTCWSYALMLNLGVMLLLILIW